MVNLRTTFSHPRKRRSQTALWGRIRARFPKTIRHHAGAIGPLWGLQGVIRVFNFRGQNMKRLLLAGVALSVASAASAADLRARPYAKAAPPAAVVAAYNWSGFYIGAMGGYGWESEGDGGGGFGGGTIGYNWQFPGSQFVFGIEVDAAGASIKDSLTADIGGGV